MKSKSGIYLKQHFSYRFLSEPDSKEYKYYQTKLKEKKEEQSSTSQASSASASSASSTQQESAPLNFDFAATLAQVKAKAAASLGGRPSAVPSMTSQEMREREKQIQEQKEVWYSLSSIPKLIYILGMLAIHYCFMFLYIHYQQIRL